MILSGKNIKNIFIYTFSKFAGYGVYFLALPVLTRLLTPKDFGIIALVWAFPIMAVNFFTCGLAPSAQRFYFEYRGDPKKLDALFFSSQLFLYAALFFSTALVFVLRNHVSALLLRDAAYGDAVFIAFIATYLGQIINFYLFLYRNMERAVEYSVFTVLQPFITALFSVLFVWIFKMSFMGPLYGAMFGSFIVCLILSMHFNKGRKRHFDGKILAENMQYGLQVSAKSLTNFINKFFDKYMLNSMLSLAVVGIYNIAEKFGEGVYLLMNAVWMALQPDCYKEVFDKGDKGSQAAGKLFTTFSFIALIPVVALIFFSQELVYLIAPPAYYKAIDIIIIILTGVSTQVFGSYTGVQYAYAKKAYLAFPITVAGTLVNVTANIFLIPRFGIVGAGVSTVLTYFALNAVATFVGQKLYNILYEWKIILSLFSYIVFSALLVLYLRYANIATPYFLAIKTVLFLGYFFICVKAGIITTSSVKALRDLIQKR